MLARRPGLADRLFSAAEQRNAADVPRNPASLAARFAAKEALAKALGAPPGLAWLDAEVVTGSDGSPTIEVRGTVAARAAELGVSSIRLSMSHDGGMATAFVIVEGTGEDRA